MPEIKVFYAVMNASQEVKRRSQRYRRSAASLYMREQDAIAQAKKEGDTVVRLTLNTGEEPVFIRSKTINPE